MSFVKHFTELRVYDQAFETAMKIFELSKGWPVEERYSLTDQIRRSSRSVCGNIAEAWRKRRYPNHFVSKLTDADGEVAETENWLKFAKSCGYLRADVFDDLWNTYERITGGIVNMMSNPEAWCAPSHLLRESVADYLVRVAEEFPNNLCDTPTLPHPHTPIPPNSQTPTPPHDA